MMPQGKGHKCALVFVSLGEPVVPGIHFLLRTRHTNEDSTGGRQSPQARKAFKIYRLMISSSLKK